MTELDVRWEGWSHKQIHDRVQEGRGAATTEGLERALTDLSETLDAISGRLDGVVRRIDSGEWTGQAATAATSAIRVLRDFHETLAHHSRMNALAAYGQSDNAAWARANVPPYVDTRPMQAPTGSPLDAVNATADHQRELATARNAEERARQVMRQYEAMSTARVAALPELSPMPRLVITSGDDVTMVVDGPDRGDVRTPGNSTPPGTGPSSAKPHPDESPQVPAGPPDGTDVPTTPAPAPAGPGTSGSGASGSGTAGFRPAHPVPGSADVSAPTRAATTDGFAAADGSAGPPDRAATDWAVADRGQGDGARSGGVGVPGARPGVGAPQPVVRGGVAGLPGRVSRDGQVGAVPGGAARKGEDGKERHGRYAVPGSEIFEPDHDDGLLHDPFRPGSFVAPAAIGDEDE